MSWNRFLNSLNVKKAVKKAVNMISITNTESSSGLYVLALAGIGQTRKRYRVSDYKANESRATIECSQTFESSSFSSRKGQAIAEKERGILFLQLLTFVLLVRF